MILQSQLDKASETEIASNRELQRRIDRGEHEVIRLQEKVREGDEHLRESQVRVASLEREVMTFQDTIFRKDRSLREVNAKLDSLVGQREQLREAMESELDGLQAELKEEKEHCMSLVRNHQKELEEMKQDVENKIPSIVSGVTNHAEMHFNEQLQNEIAAVKVRYSHQVNALKHEIVEMQAGHQEAVIRLKSRASNESIEMDAMRQKTQQLEDKNRELAATIETLASHNKHAQLLNLGSSQSSGRYAMPMAPQMLDSSALNISGANVMLQGGGGVQEDIDTSRASTMQHLQHPPSNELNTIAAQLANMRTQLNQSMETRTSNVRASNNSGVISRQQFSLDEDVELEHSGRIHAGRPVNKPTYPSPPRNSGKENTVPRSRRSDPNADIHDNDRPFTSSKDTRVPSEDPLSSTFNYSEATSTYIATPPRPSTGNTSKYHEAPEALFDSPINAGKVRVDDSILNESDYFTRHDYGGRNSGTESDVMPADSSLYSSKLTSDFASIQDGGYHEGYWKAKYLRK